MNKKIAVIEKPITDVLRTNYMPYAMSVIVSRAIPEIDGFKPSHRKLLYTMYKMGLLTGLRTKSSNVVGQTMRLNPHGDSAIYETLVRLTIGNDSLITPFVDSKGNFGKQYSKDMAYAAARYTEVKLSDICNEIFSDIEKSTVPFVDNFDGTTKEPVLLPVKFPNILVNPNTGIAVGMASSFCGFNLSEVCEATIACIKNEDANLLDYLKGPDFSTGGEYILNKGELKKIYETGRGTLKVRAKYIYDKKNSCIEITQIPYSTTIEAIIEKIIQLVKSNKIKEINDVRDETDLNGLKITIDVKRNTNVDVLMHRLFKETSLQDNFSCNFNVLINGVPKTLGVKEIIKEWLLFRINALKSMFAYDLVKKQEKMHLLEGLQKIIVDIDKAIKIIRDTTAEAEVIPNLMQAFDITQLQADYICEIKLRNINKEYLLNRTKELTNLKEEIEAIKKTLESKDKLQQIICKELSAISKKYGKPRKTDIILETDIEEIDTTEIIPDYDVKFFLTRENYFKKISNISYMKASEQKLKEDDIIISACDGNNRSDLLFFSDKQNVYKMKAKDIEDHKASVMGEYLQNVLEMAEDEKIIYMTSTLNYNGYMLFFFENGKLAKINLSSYSTKVNRKKLINAFSDKCNVVSIFKIDIDKDFAIIRDNDKATLLNTELVQPKALKNSGGVQVMKLKKNSKVTAVYAKENFNCEDTEYYRTSKVPTVGHFIKESDKSINNIPKQLNFFE